MSKQGWKQAMAFLAVWALLCAGVAPASGEIYPFVEVTADVVPLRSLPSETASVIAHVPENRALLITGSQGQYYAAAYDGQTGYVLQSLLSADRAVVYTALAYGSKGQQVEELQAALKKLGFYASSVDGKYGSGTRNAVRSFQRINNLSVTGTADMATQALLYQGNPKNAAGIIISQQAPVIYTSLSRGSKGEKVNVLQARLKELGYYTGKIDGDFGNGTYNAVRAFQQKAGLKKTGIADQDTQLLLHDAAAPAARQTAAPQQTAVPQPVATPQPSGGYPYETHTTSSVNLRQKASISSARLATVPKGARVTVLSDGESFVQVSYNSLTGYLMRDYVYIPAQYLPGNALEEDGQAQKDYQTLTLNSRGAAVKALQEALEELGFYTGAADGVFGAGTQTALKAFQKKNSLRQDGQASPELQQLIYEGRPLNSRGKKTTLKTLPPIEGYPMQLNDRGDAVIELQRKLASLGYFTSTFTATYNSATQKAVKAFQQDHSLTVDGKAGEKTLRLLTLLCQTPVPGPTQVPVNTPLTDANVIVMQNGTRGQAVERLQQRLMELGYYQCTVDGVYDSNEIAAVRDFQKRNGLKADGIAGLDTQRLLYSEQALPAAGSGIVLPTPVPFTTPDMTVTLRSGSQGEYVRLLQERLIVLGYYSGAVDGNYGSGTLRAVVTFQQFHGLGADGVAGRKTQEVLYSHNAKTYAQAKPTPAPTPRPTATPKPNAGSTVQTPVTIQLLKTGSRGEAVRQLQQRLADLGYLTVADGVYGPKTFNAVVSFQKKNGLTADGIAGAMTQNKLYSATAVGANGGTVSLPSQSPSSGGSQAGSSSFRAPDASQVRYANWYTEIRSRAKLMPDVVIYDPDTGLHYNLHMFSFGKHADSEPVTKEDVEIMNRIIGEDDWSPKYVWVIFSDGRVYIGSTHSKGHTVDHNNANGLTGHICLHFPRIMSEAEATGPYAVSHQKEILWGWELTQAMIK